MDLVDLMQSMSVVDSQLKSNFKIGAINLEGHHTDLVFGDFVNKSIIIVTQFEKVGSLLRVTIDQPADDLNIVEPVYSVSVIFGADSCEQQAAARYIAEHLNTKKPLLIFICLKSYSTETVRAVASAIKDLQNK